VPGTVSPAEREDPLLSLDVFQRPARYELHRDELFAVQFHEVVDPADVFVRDPPGQDDLAAQGLLPFRRHPVRPDAFQGDVLIELDVPGAVDDAHAAVAEDRLDPVPAAQQRPRFQRPVGCLSRGAVEGLAGGGLAVAGHTRIVRPLTLPSGGA
jgi:hypothetical protein